jgi:hypothetical protein
MPDPGAEVRMTGSAWDQIDSLARLAPTSHNTQPFRIRPLDEHHAEIVVLADRLLPREDHGNLYMASAFGILAETIRLAGLHNGLVVDVAPMDGVVPAALHERLRTVVGRIEVTGQCTPCDQRALLEARRTSRLPYHGRVVPPDSVRALGVAAARHGQRFLAFDDEATVRWMMRRNVDAVIDNLQLDDERAEIRGWYRSGKTPAIGDGLWVEPMNQPSWELRAAFAAPHVFGLPGIRQVASAHYVHTQRGTRHVALICGAFRTWPELIAAGRMLLDLWLEMARHDVYMHPMGSMLTNPRYAEAVARRFGVDDCWLALRFGYSDPPPRAPRLSTILTYE